MSKNRGSGGCLCRAGSSAVAHVDSITVDFHQEERVAITYDEWMNKCPKHNLWVSVKISEGVFAKLVVTVGANEKGIDDARMHCSLEVKFPDFSKKTGGLVVMQKEDSVSYSCGSLPPKPVFGPYTSELEIDDRLATLYSGVTSAKLSIDVRITMLDSVVSPALQLMRDLGAFKDVDIISKASCYEGAPHLFMEDMMDDQSEVVKFGEHCTGGDRLAAPCWPICCVCIASKNADAAENTDAGHDIERCFSAHKVVLSAISPVFRACLESQMVESKNNRLDLQEHPIVISAILDSAYGFPLATNYSPLQLLAIYVAADKYSLKELGQQVFADLAAFRILDRAVLLAIIKEAARVGRMDPLWEFAKKLAKAEIQDFSTESMLKWLMKPEYVGFISEVFREVAGISEVARISETVTDDD